MSKPAVAIIVVAAGSGSRLGHAEPKAFVDLRAIPILEHALNGVFDSVEPAQVIVVAPKAKVSLASAIAKRAAGAAAASVTVVAGGDTRQASVAAGLAVLGDGVDVVLVHDAARALTPGSLFDRVVSAVRAGGGVIPALPVSDTVKRIDRHENVLETVDRRDLVQVQTPQGFPRAELVAAYAGASQEFTDDAALFQDAGGAVTVVEGEARAFKITTPWDLRRAENLLGETSGIRTGIGVDVHAYDDSAPLWLGGLYWPDEPGLAGHSDGDALVHAICDALLSAAGLGDMGSRFGVDDPRFAGARSEVFLRETLALIAGSGFTVGNVAVQVIGTRPRLSPRRDEVETRLTALVGAPVSVSATTSDGLGFTGRGEGLTAIATALLTS
ncbi:MAG TPA: 2-C-methyl-D-erythritol 4-phosphate cytidylyltransferase [Pseudolysinimonas sp.]|nr:2-C-methyl-D-erythritol 4-phosphate cytidylyltransferase [Pseudolysinimonas sp.]